MNDLESRLRSDLQSAGDAIHLPAGDIQGVVRRGRMRKMVSSLAATAAVVVVAGAVWQITRSASTVPVVTPTAPTTTTTATPPSDAVLDPNLLDWKQVDGPPVDKVLSAWTMQDGRFAVWSGSEVWTSTDGEAWSHAASTPDGMFSYDSFHTNTRFEGTWIGIGGGDTATVFRSEDGTSWDQELLPTDALPTSNPLLVRTVRASFVASTTDRVMIAGVSVEMVDRDAAVAALAPELVAEGNTIEVTDTALVVHDASGTVLRSIPLSDIDVRLTDSYLLSTVVWSSDDGLHWTMAQLPGDQVAPLSLTVLGNRFVVGTTSLNNGQGGLWASTTSGALREVVPSGFFPAVGAWGDQLIASIGQTLVAFGTDWQQQALVLLPEVNGDVATADNISAGRVGIAIAAFDHTRSSVPLQAVLFSPDATTWQVTSADVFGEPGNARVIVNEAGVLVFYGPGQDGGATPLEPFTTWIATPRRADEPVVDTTLEVEPADGLPGNPLTVCGTTPGVTSLELVLTGPENGDVWPSHEFVDVESDAGDWCWSGTIPTQLETLLGPNAGHLYPIPPGTYQLTAESGGEVLATGDIQIGAADPSQSAEDAARDGVLPAVAVLPFDLRVTIYDELDTTEGRWVLSQPSPSVPLILGDCDPADAGCVYGRDYVVNGEYGEVLLLDSTSGQILRAYPLPGFPVEHRGSILVTDEAVFCSSQGDGALPDSMLCRIDRSTLDWMVRVFPSSVDSGFNPVPTDQYIPDNWMIDRPVNDAMFLGLKETLDGLVTEGYLADYVINPMTLELTRVPVSGPATTTDPAG